MDGKVQRGGQGATPYVDRAAVVSRLKQLEAIPLSFTTFFSWGKAQWSLYSEKKKLIQESKQTLNTTLQTTNLSSDQKQIFENFGKMLFQTLSPSDLAIVQSLMQTQEGLDYLFHIPKGLTINEVKKQFLEHLTFALQHSFNEFEEVLGFYRDALTEEDLAPFKNFLSTRDGLQYLKQIKSIAKEGDSLQDVVKYVVTGMKNHPKEMPGLALRTLSTFEDVKRMMGGRFAEGDALKYATSWLQMAANNFTHYTYEEFSQLLTDFEKYINEAKIIQEKRPAIFKYEELTQFSSARSNIFNTPAIFINTFMNQIVNNIDVTTFSGNTSSAEEYINTLYLERKPSNRNISAITARNPGEDPYSLSYALNPTQGMIHTQDSDTPIEFRAKTGIYTTNEKTGETRALLQPLPYEGTMTETEMRSYSYYLTVLYNSSDPKVIDRYPQTLKPEDKALCTSLFLDWCIEMKAELPKLDFDFNATETRPTFAFARELPETKKALENPQSAEFALEAAKMQNIYRLQEGRLSLLPPELTDHKGIAEIDKEELTRVQDLFVKTELIATEKITLPVKKDGKVEMEDGTIEFDYSWVTQNLPADTLGIEVKTTLKCEGRTHSRTTFYLYKEKAGEAGKAIPALQNVVNTGFLHIDLLLAKAEYLEMAFPKEPTHVDETLAVFKEAAKEQDFPIPFIDEVARRYIQPVAEKLGEERAHELRDFVTTKEGIFFIKHLVVARIHTEDRTNMILLAMENPRVLNAMNLMFQNNELHSDRVLSLFARTERILGNRLTENTHLETFEVFRSIASKEGADTIFANWGDFLTKAENIHSLRPRVLNESDPEVQEATVAFVNFQNSVFPLSVKNPEIPDTFIIICAQIIASYFVNNSQPIGDNVRAYLSPLFSPRTAPLLEAQDAYSLKTESHPDLFLQQDSDLPIGSELYATYHITNPKTMETRTMRQRLPLTADMTITEARKKLSVLDKTIEESKVSFSDETFEHAYLESGLPQNKKEETRAQFKDYITKGNQLLAEITLDFNGTAERPSFSFAREEVITRNALEHPDSKEDAIKAAAQQNIYLFQGKRSLLPAEIAGNHLEVATITTEELTLAKQLEPTPLELPGGAGTVSFVTEEIDTKVAMKQFVVTKLTTTIKRGDETLSRATYYYRDQFNEIVNSSHFERDLLLAKAAFMNKFSTG